MARLVEDRIPHQNGVVENLPLAVDDAALKGIDLEEARKSRMGVGPTDAPPVEEPLEDEPEGEAHDEDHP